ncbi:MAG: VWA domain-containing protein [Deferribacteres bacterium]|nr:VWA domain-containing protein [candidate division KSB1 bacterium]MCB9503811.1 VWA domain-containing protein [Deferribacteres bacterium]
MKTTTTWGKLTTALIPFALFVAYGAATTSSYATDSLKVTVNNPVIDTSLTINGVTGSFPFSVLTTISVTDSAGNAVTGLADTTDWLGANDTAMNGQLIKDIWQPLFEYHKENPQYPDNPNIYTQKPDMKILEVQRNEQLSSSVMMVMDLSYSMRASIEPVRAATKLFVDSLEQGQRSGLIQFAGEITKVVDFTTNKDELYKAIDEGQASGGTPLADALGLAIQMLKEEATARHIVVAYTDGHEIDSKIYTISMVIDSAKAYNIPIYMIGLGSDIRPDTLQRIATETGGEYLPSGSAADMAAIYSRLSQVIKNYYVLKYTSPDPYYNNSYRILEVNINNNSRHGRGTGQYYVKGPGATDVSLTLTSTTADTAMEGGLVYNAAYEDSLIDYSIVIFNNGPIVANSIRITHELPIETDYVGSSVQPESLEDNILAWHIQSLQPGQAKVYNVRSKVRMDVPIGTKDLVATASMVASNDTLSTNNSATNIVKYLGTYPRYDGSLTMPFVTPGIFSAGGFEFGRVGQHESYSYSLVIRNKGNRAIKNAKLTNWIPDSVRIDSISTEPASSINAELNWNLPDIPALDSLIINVKAHLADNMPVGSHPLPHRAQLDISADEVPADNTAEETIYAVILRENNDLAITLSSRTDTTVAGRNAVKADDIYTYTFNVSNNGAGAADNVVVRQNLPAYVVFVQDGLNGLTTNNWQIGTLQSGQTKSINVAVKVAHEVPENIQELIGSVEITSPLDTVAWNNTAMDTIAFITVQEEVVFNYDLAIETEVITDTTVSIEGTVQPASRIGSVYLYKLSITNNGPGVAENIRVLDNLPEEVFLYQLSKKTIESTQADLVWDIDSLSSGQIEEISFYARVSDNIRQTPFALVNQAEVVSARDTVATNNVSTSTVYAVHSSGYSSDIAVENFVHGSSFVFADNDTTWFAEGNSNYSYSIVIKNSSDAFADSVFVTEHLPQGATPVESSFSTQPRTATSTTLQWVFEAIEPHGSRIIQFNMFIPAPVSNDIRTFTHVANAGAANELERYAGNNEDSAVIYSIVEVPEPEIAISPESVLVGDSVQVRVRTSIELKSWDLRIYTADNQVDDTYADAFISSTMLQPGVWLDITPLYRNVRLFTLAKEEIIRFELVTVDYLYNTKRVSADLTVKARNDMVLERNVFRAGREDRIGINFQLSSNREVRLDLYDLSGTLITTIEEGPYSAGRNTYFWDGYTSSGQKVGSGVYLVTLRSGEYTSWKKMVVVQ